MNIVIELLAITALAGVAVVAFLAIRYRAPDLSRFDLPRTALIIAVRTSARRTLTSSGSWRSSTATVPATRTSRDSRWKHCSTGR